jgi:two-component system phosphate regulon sensor histidine kinase PhoR
VKERYGPIGLSLAGVVAGSAAGAAVALEYGSGRWSASVAVIVLIACATVVTAALYLAWRIPATRRHRRLLASLDRIVSGGALLSEMGSGEEHALARAINAIVRSERAAAVEHQKELLLLRSLIEGSPNGVIVVGNDGRVCMVNEAYRGLFSARSEIVGRAVAEIVSEPEVLEVVAKGRQGRAEEVSVSTGDGRDLLLRPIMTPHGDIAVLVQDVSRFKEAERARTAFVANVSHELRTPMAAIMGYAELLQLDVDELPERARPLVDAVARNSRRLRDTFEGLLHLARLEARSAGLPLATLSLSPLVDAAVAGAREEAVAKGVAFEVSVPPELVIQTNAEAFSIILGNLAINAVRYTPQGGAIALTAVHDGDRVMLDVVDNGIGIEPANQQRIFERFFRVDEGRTRDMGGSGLGLAIVKHLCLASGAIISVHSALGAGSTFRVSFPAPSTGALS